jgi:ComF family protein
MLVAAYHRFQLNAEVIVPVPLHRRRQLTRGFNQSEALAQVLSHHLGLPMNKTSLQRIRPTQTQIDLTVTERQRNVKGAFACLDQELAGRTVLLVDDVCTTGATLDACAAALRQAHSGPVWALTLSRATIDPAPVDPT